MRYEGHCSSMPGERSHSPEKSASLYRCPSRLQPCRGSEGQCTKGDELRWATEYPWEPPPAAMLDHTEVCLELDWNLCLKYQQEAVIYKCMQDQKELQWNYYTPKATDTFSPGNVPSCIHQVLNTRWLPNHFPTYFWNHGNWIKQTLNIMFWSTVQS